MGDDIEFYLVIFDIESPFDFLLNILFLCFNKAIQFSCTLDNVAPPIIIKLKAGEMAISPAADYLAIWSTIAWANSEHLTSLAPSI